MQEAYIVAGYRTAVGKAKKGGFRFYRPDDLAINLIKGLLASVPQLDKNLVDDVIVGNAVPEAEQCGWCKDKYGLSWQIVPENMEELMKKPNAFKTMMNQHKIVIADY